MKKSTHRFYCLFSKTYLIFCNILQHSATSCNTFVCNIFEKICYKNGYNRKTLCDDFMFSDYNSPLKSADVALRKPPSKGFSHSRVEKKKLACPIRKRLKVQVLPLQPIRTGVMLDMPERDQKQSQPFFAGGGFYEYKKPLSRINYITKGTKTNEVFIESRKRSAFTGRQNDN